PVINYQLISLHVLCWQYLRSREICRSIRSCRRKFDINISALLSMSSSIDIPRLILLRSSDLDADGGDVVINSAGGECHSISESSCSRGS
ncbi:hypothetical protein LINGRAHAP2_LOCUS30970, partial [Linum grandiflorum]